MGGYDGRTAMVTAMPSIVAESRGGRKSEFMDGGVVCVGGNIIGGGVVL